MLNRKRVSAEDIETGDGGVEAALDRARSRVLPSEMRQPEVGVGGGGEEGKDARAHTVSHLIFRNISQSCHFVV
jgi:hypothetical protein